MQIDLTKSKVVCVGRNYVEHIHELNNEVPESPVIFIKLNSSISKNLRLSSAREIHYECEIVFAFDHDSNIKAVGLGLDLTDRNLQSKLKAKGLPWELAKAFDNSAVISEFVKINNQDIEFLNFKAYKNNSLIQRGGYDLMIYKPQQIIDFLRQNEISVAENDLLMTGTPKGVGVVNEDDKFRIELFCKDRKILETTFG
ncbi:fumarylacetoacetate hydrolase family protein [Francisella noatunensis]|uniref:Fumarylacetoacetate hydrolase family protein n=1 Tax=Francisella noatunensis TaxID=657445 RepID=A0A9Q2KVP0_9GAMM|nr:fumarylacetoacetate hydrolase family protein [Francisella noatunensis]MBK2029312.1 fumarylacetoacetate hydrolase family protein [Francisella noatunensis]MBK2034379.1 fumarylacetoacetate hydrolase family protein [Francisella noatunensis]MBK2048350.1 fumarylacetoacetate hydrolase family protein [Francisella noatunensis]MBK2049800.1 fumarylacetoacetate hydrolase family protein [Francisella noatunensis]MBK2051861.1 fumarylacetoacetate hydrolase family protein [Francisella noatunensis]